MNTFKFSINLSISQVTPQWPSLSCSGTFCTLLLVPLPPQAEAHQV